MTKRINNPKGKGGFAQHPEHINKNGAPKKCNTFKNLLLEKLDEQFIIKNEALGMEKDTGLSYKQALVEAWIERAINGSYSHLKEIIDRIDGKIPEPQRGESDEIVDLSIIANLLLKEGIGWEARKDEIPNENYSQKTDR